MSPEPQAPIWRRFLQRRRYFAKSSPVSLSETLEECPPNTLYSEPPVEESNDLQLEFTPTAELSQGVSPELPLDDGIDLLPIIASLPEPGLQFPLELSLDDPTDRILAITSLPRLESQFSLELSLDDPTDRILAITSLPEPELQLSLELSLDDPTERMAAITPLPKLLHQYSPSVDGSIDLRPAVTPVSEAMPQYSFGLPLDDGIDLRPAVTPVSEAMPQYSFGLPLDDGIDLPPAVTPVSEAMPQYSFGLPLDDGIDLPPAITPVSEAMPQYSFDLPLDDGIDLPPAITPVAEAMPQYSFEPSIDNAIDLLPAVTPVAEAMPQYAFDLPLDDGIDLLPAATPVAEAMSQYAFDLPLDDGIDLPPAITPVAEAMPQYAFDLPLDDGIDLPPAIAPVSEPLQLASQPPSLMRHPLKRRQKQQKSRKKKLSVLFAFCCIITIITVVFMGQGNGAGGAWMADTLRSLAGPTMTAQIESWYLGLSNTASQMQYQLGNKQVNTPWKVATKGSRLMPTPIPSPTPPAWSTLSPMPLSSMPPLVSPALAGEGAWTVQDNAPAPYDYLPLDAKAFIRPDPSHPYAIVTLQQFDSRFTLLHVVGGTVEPGGPRGVHGAGIIPEKDLQGNTLLAVFNGGFKYSDGQYGLMTNGVVYVPPQLNAATIAITKEGKLILGLWGVDPLLNSQNADLVAWRQNGALLIDQGAINPLTHDGAAWGGTILNSVYTWRSAIGITAQGTLLYAAGNSLTAETLGAALKAAGAVMAMQTDINPFWVRAFLYNRDHNGQLAVSKLNPQMQGTGYEYLYGMQRDFFYLTRFAPAVPPSNNQSPPR